MYHESKPSGRLSDQGPWGLSAVTQAQAQQQDKLAPGSVQQSEVNQEMDRLRLCVEYLANTVDKFTGRLQPVLHPTGTGGQIGTNEASHPDAVICPLADHIRLIRKIVDAQQSKLQTALDELGI